jgi:predicted Zn-dependent protease
MRQAHVFFDEKNFEWAGLAAQKAFYWRADSVEACRLLGEIAERQRLGQALDWRRRAVDLQPESLPDLIALAETALRFSQPKLAASTLERVPDARRNDSAYQSVAAHVALTLNQPEDALAHLKKAAELAPNDLRQQLELADFEIRSKDDSLRIEGRALASRLKALPDSQFAALGLLLDDALQTQDASKASALAKELIGLEKAPFEGRLRGLSALRASNDPDFVGVLGRMQAEARGSVGNAAALINWMNSNSLAVLAIHWSKELPTASLDSMPLRAALADSYVIMHDWHALEAMLKRGSWPLSAESLRLALLSKVAFENGDGAAADKYWTDAIKKSTSNSGSLQSLQHLASQWQWTEKEAKILWLLVEKPATQSSALQALYRLYTRHGDSTGLYRTFLRLAQISPGDRSIENNLVQLSLLLNLNRSDAQEKAKKLHEAEPSNIAFASTYAFALHRGGNDAAAIKLMESFPAEQLQDPSIAAYYGIILASKKDNEATRYLDLGAKATLLPEEQNLVAQARKEIAQR